MENHNKCSSAVGSSIVLLQERFKQLQRLKDIRQERQLLKRLSQSINGFDGSTNPCMRSPPPDEASHDPLALGLDSNHAPCVQAVKPVVQQPTASASRGKHSDSFEVDSDVVDTSLRL
ncbi:protein cereblon homolog [Striga asiatica]|uniref:Protein cereblon homolog n=1 Tax=Striga asiatica TaxID=4170 RepID=A0A5A7R9D9_STRAF|nr:protein cereblon homolog [Striga asiatica]